VYTWLLLSLVSGLLLLHQTTMQWLLGTMHRSETCLCKVQAQMASCTCSEWPKKTAYGAHEAALLTIGDSDTSFFAAHAADTSAMTCSIAAVQGVSQWQSGEIPDWFEFPLT
jgi:hypothetical protein